MRFLMISMALLSFAKMCGGGDSASSPPVSAAATSAITVTAQHGGVMVAADDAWIELVAKGSGEVEAYVVDAQGVPMPQEAAHVTHVEIQGDDGRPHQVQLQWDESRRVYAGRVDVQPVATAPAEVRLVVRGQPRQVRAPRIVVIPPSPPQINVAVQADVPSSAVAEPHTVVVTPPSRVAVEAPRPPRVVVEARSPQVVEPQRTVVVAPPRPSIVMTPPTPPTVVVTPPRPGRVEVRGAGRVEVRGRH